MKNFFVILLTITTLSVFGQKPQFVDLKWNIAEDEKLNYATVMNDIGDSIEIDFSRFLKVFSMDIENDIKETFDNINQTIKNINYVTTLTSKGNGVIDVVMKTAPKEQSEEMANFEKSMESLMKILPEEQLDGIEEDTTSEEMDDFIKGFLSIADTTDEGMADFFSKSLQLMFQEKEGIVTLRGSVYETGEIHSFWVKSDQRNLIALFFELPSKPVKIGDKWSLDVNLIANDQSFECDSAYKINEVTLSDIKTVNGETIAVLKYNIVEYVNGIFNASAFFGNEAKQIETMMKFTHIGIAEFSIDKGRWIIYDGIMSLEATGAMTANKKTKFTLINEKDTNR